MSTENVEIQWRQLHVLVTIQSNSLVKRILRSSRTGSTGTAFKRFCTAVVPVVPVHVVQHGRRDLDCTAQRAAARGCSAAAVSQQCTAAAAAAARRKPQQPQKHHLARLARLTRSIARRCRHQPTVTAAALSASPAAQAAANSFRRYAS